MCVLFFVKVIRVLTVKVSIFDLLRCLSVFDGKLFCGKQRERWNLLRILAPCPRDFHLTRCSSRNIATSYSTLFNNSGANGAESEATTEKKREGVGDEGMIEVKEGAG